MGMDVYGKNPKNEIGQYFRNNVWWWHPLWDYMETHFPAIASKVEYAHSNSGSGLNAIDAKKLADKLAVHIKDGSVKRYEESYMKSLEELELEDCEYCEQTGTRKWAPGSFVYLEEAKKENVLKDELGNIILTCNACNGLGKKKSFQCNYPFSEENVIEFQKFLANCGGFSIW